MSRQFLHTVGTILLVVTVAPFVVFAVPQLVGATDGYVVSSSSMSPAIHAGDVVIVDDVRPAEIEQGDVITFERHGGRDGQQSSRNRVTHRVVDVVERDDGRYFRTKGDANEDPDSQLVPAEDVGGEVLFTIPVIGWVISFASTNIGIIAFAIIPGVLLLIDELWGFYRAIHAARSEQADGTGSSSDE